MLCASPPLDSGFLSMQCSANIQRTRLWTALQTHAILPCTMAARSAGVTQYAEANARMAQDGRCLARWPGRPGDCPAVLQAGPAAHCVVHSAAGAAGSLPKDHFVEAEEEGAERRRP